MAGTGIALKGGGAAGNANMQRAQLLVFSCVKAHAEKHLIAAQGAQLGSLDFQFNPKELSVQKSAQWTRVASKRAGTAAPAEFKGTEPTKLSLEMFLDATEHQDDRVLRQVELLLSCLVPQGSGSEPWPPLVRLQWGSLSSFVGFVSSVQVKYTLFTPGGTPIRASCSIAVEEAPQGPGRQNPTSGALTETVVHPLVEGESLAALAHREYGDPTLWRPLAAFNGIDDPFRVPVGTMIRLPQVHELPGPER